MKHLTVDEIIDFVSVCTLDSDTLEKAAAVTTHMRSCEECMRRVRAFQLVYDACLRRGKTGEFERTAREMASQADGDVQMEG